MTKNRMKKWRQGRGGDDWGVERRGDEGAQGESGRIEVRWEEGSP